MDVTPWETASGGKAVECVGPGPCTLTEKLDKPVGAYSVAVQYFDLNSGASSYELLLNGRQVAAWKADMALPSRKLDGHTATRFTVPRVELKPGDTLTLRGTPDGGERAPVDYVEIDPASRP